jgi:hypothetical protein
MKMIGHQRPGIDDQISVATKDGQAIQEIIPVPRVLKDFGSLDPPADEVMQRAGRIQPGLSGHEESLSGGRVPVK